jgi:hypothetical protein
MWAILLAILFCSLSILYEWHFPTLMRSNDVWFAADVPRANHSWMRGVPTRFVLHPLPCAVYVVYGKLFTVFGIDPRGLPMAVTALPLIVYSSLCLGLVMALVSRHFAIPRPARPVVLVAFLMIGPALLFAPLPENHFPGGVSLLAEAAFVYSALRRLHGGDGSPEPRKEMLLAVLFAALATGFSVSNVVPAALALLPLLLVPRIRRRYLLKISIVVLVVLAGLLIFRDGLRPQYEFERNFIAAPTAHSVHASFRALATAQLGVPPTYLRANSSHNMPPSTIMADATASFLSLAAFLLLVLGVAVWYSRETTRNWERSFVLSCLAALLSLIVFHSSYGTEEAYLFSPHGTTFVVLPGVLAWAHAIGRERRVEAYALLLVLALATLRNGMSLMVLFRDVAPMG